MEEIKPEEVYYYEDASSNTITTTTTANYLYPNLQARMNVMPIIEKLNEIIRKINGISRD